MPSLEAGHNSSPSHGKGPLHILLYFFIGVTHLSNQEVQEDDNDNKQEEKIHHHREPPVVEKRKTQKDTDSMHSDGWIDAAIYRQVNYWQGIYLAKIDTS